MQCYINIWNTDMNNDAQTKKRNTFVEHEHNSIACFHSDNATYETTQVQH